MFDDGQDAYQSLRAIVSERTTPLIAWTGSGVSAPSGLPTWVELKDELVAAASRKASTYSPSDANATAATVDEIRRSRDYWTAFTRLKDVLGKTTYEEAIRSALAKANDVAVPSTYIQLWNLPIRGMFTLNLDRLATRSFSSVYGDQLPVEVSGPQIARLSRVLFGKTRFIGNLHGVVDDTSTWVFTRPELRDLTADLSYQYFIRQCLSSFANIFVGINPDDEAVGSHLSFISSLKLDTTPNYWVTDRRDRATDRWAEESGLRVVRYVSKGSDHGELEQLLKGLVGYVPIEPDSPPPVSMTVRDSLSTVESPPVNMMSLSSEDLRKLLNARAAIILEPGTEEAYAEYDRFSAANDELIYRAWYTSVQEDKNDLLGYRLVDEIARGAFGRVYRAISPVGDQVAVKVLLDEIRRDPSLLRSFRRGVRSMTILQKYALKGMVAYREASEIPAFVVMDFIEGPNLNEAREAKLVCDWPSVLEISLQITQTIRRAHALPERVLHRDIRPANIMLRNYWAEPDELDVVVLDFDLSWHRGSIEHSIVFTTASGYLAPEQQTQRPRESTRNAAVDSFGLGMTFFFLIAGVDPVPNQHMHRDWEQTVETASASLAASPTWRSAPRRFSRLVIGSTADAQSARWDLTAIENQLRLLQEAVEDGRTESSELVVEELATRSGVLERYVWNEDSSSANVESPSGLRYELGGDEIRRTVYLDVEWARTGMEQRTGLTKYILEGVSALEARLRKAGWTIDRRYIGGESFNVRATIGTTRILTNIGLMAETLDDALSMVQLNSGR